MIELEVPIVQAPMAGGPSTPTLTAAVSGAGGLGFLAAGYRPAADVRAEVIATRELTGRAFGVNVFVPSGQPADPEAIVRYADRLRPQADALGVELGRPGFDDDHYEHKIDVLEQLRPAVVSFTFGCPSPAVVRRLRRAGISVWMTVTDPREAEVAARARADALVVQGAEAGGHRGSFVDADDHEDHGLLALISLVTARTDLPLVAAGGIATGPAVAAVLAAGATAAQIGTAFLRCPEAGTHPLHADALTEPRRTGLTRAFSGRLARGLRNTFQSDHSGDAPIAYPEVHHLTAPLRAAARQRGDVEQINLWAGQTHELARAVPAAQLVAELARDAAAAVNRVQHRPRFPT